MSANRHYRVRLQCRRPQAAGDDNNDTDNGRLNSVARPHRILGQHPVMLHPNVTGLGSSLLKAFPTRSAAAL
jgi:hypothetical protein